MSSNGNGIVKALTKAAGVAIPDDFDLASVLSNVEGMRAELINCTTGIDQMRIALQALVHIEMARAEHEGAAVPAEIRELVAEMVIED